TMSTLEIYEFTQNNLALTPFWETVQTGFARIEDNENLMPDITYWVGASLVLSPRAYRYLNEMLAPFGEFLPVVVDADTYYIFNCLAVADVAGEDISGEGPKFYPIAEAGKGAFKPPRDYSMAVYC